MRLPLLIFPLVVLLPACGDDVVQDPTTTTTNPGTTGGSSSSTGPADPTTGPADTSATGPAATSTGSTSTGPQTTGESTGTTSDDSGLTGPGESTSTGETTGDDTGPVLPGECVDNADCKLFSDCCECKGVPITDDQPICKLGCDETPCEQIAVDESVCRLGQCIVERLDCDASQVICLALPPECPKGTVPGVQGQCWSGACVPGEICNVVPDCTYCPETDWMCVTKIAFGPQSVTCEPIPEDCMGEPSCECAGAVCTPDFSFCSDPGGDQLNCECINC